MRKPTSIPSVSLRRKVFPGRVPHSKGQNFAPAAGRRWRGGQRRGQRCDARSRRPSLSDPRGRPQSPAPPPRTHRPAPLHPRGAAAVPGRPSFLAGRVRRRRRDLGHPAKVRRRRRKAGGGAAYRRARGEAAAGPGPAPRGGEGVSRPRPRTPAWA